MDYGNIRDMLSSTTQNLIQEAMELDSKTLIERGLKLSEETGELAQAILRFEQVSGCIQGATREDILEESADVILVALSIMLELNCSEQEIDEILLRKSMKWKTKVNRTSKKT